MQRIIYTKKQPLVDDEIVYRDGVAIGWIEKDKVYDGWWAIHEKGVKLYRGSRKVAIKFVNYLHDGRVNNNPIAPGEITNGGKIHW